MKHRVCPCRGDRDPLCEPELLAGYGVPGVPVRLDLAEKLRAEYANRPVERVPRPQLPRITVERVA